MLLFLARYQVHRLIVYWLKTRNKWRMKTCSFKECLVRQAVVDGSEPQPLLPAATPLLLRQSSKLVLDVSGLSPFCCFAFCLSSHSPSS